MGQVGQEDGRNCKNKKVKESEETDMKKRVMITGIILAMAIVGAGCGAKSNSSETAQAETTVKEEKKEVTKSNKRDINTDEINNSNIDSEDTMQEEDSTETSDMSAGKQESNDSAKSSKDVAKTADKKAATVTTGSNTTTNNTTAAESNTEKNNNTQQNTNSSNNNSSTQTESTQATHTHTWQHIEANGHYETVIVQEAWDEEAPVYENVAHSICNVCGADVTGNTASHAEAHALAYEGSGHHTEWRYEQTRTQTVHHAAVTEQRWVQDSSAYDRCTTCGEIK